MTIQLTHYSKNILKKGKILTLSFFLSTLSLSANDHLKYDFTNDKNRYILSGELEAYSNKVPFNIFEKDWKNPPQKKKNNKALGKSSFNFSYKNNENIKLGVFSQKEAAIEINHGFVDTWYSANKDWTTLINKKNFSDIAATPINGELNYQYTKGIYLQKILNIYPKHYLSFKTKFFLGEQIQNLKAYGSNSETRFNLIVDYYYSNKNIITKSTKHDNSFNGYGYGFDLEYIYKDTDIYFYGGVFNIGAFIDWKSITYMHYELDSDNFYKSDPKYPQVKLPLASGYYKFDINYKQKLPLCYRSLVEYKVIENFSVGDNIFIYNNTYFNELFIKTKINKNSYKIGYILESENLTFGINIKNNLDFEVSNKLGVSNRNLLASLKIKF